MSTKEQLIDKIMRVDHAGEYGARRIYLGQMRALKNSPVYPQLKEMYEHEQEHLDFFESEIVRRHGRPTVMLPIWHVAGYGLGYVTGILGEKAAMACTIAVEEVIGEHYQGQYDELQDYEDEAELASKIAKFREDELEHRDIGKDHNAEDMPLYPLLYNAVKGITKLAVKISEKF